MGPAARIVGMIVGLVGSAFMFLTNISYNLVALLRPYGDVKGVTGAPFWLGMVCVLLAFVGATLAPFDWMWSVALMLVGTVGFFFFGGAWALIPALTLVVAAGLVFLGRGGVMTSALVREPVTRPTQPTGPTVA